MRRLRATAWRPASRCFSRSRWRSISARRDESRTQRSGRGRACTSVSTAAMPRSLSRFTRSPRKASLAGSCPSNGRKLSHRHTGRSTAGIPATIGAAPSEAGCWRSPVTTSISSTGSPADSACASHLSAAAPILCRGRTSPSSAHPTVRSRASASSPQRSSMAAKRTTKADAPASYLAFVSITAARIWSIT